MGVSSQGRSPTNTKVYFALLASLILPDKPCNAKSEGLDTMHIEEGLEAFFFRNKSFSPHTQLWYERRLLAFLDWLKTQGYTELEQITPKIIAQYIDEMKVRNNLNADKPLSSYTVHAHARIIRTVFNWLETTEEF